MSCDTSKGNFAYIDNQNLFMATQRQEDAWRVDMRRLRIYLREKYGVSKAYLFMGAFDINRQDLYAEFQDAGYVLVFREHGINFKGKKKGNVDVDIVFEPMRDALTNDLMDRAVLISGDGDYYRVIKYLKDIGKLEKVLLPSRRSASSLYKQLTDKYLARLDDEGTKAKIRRDE